MDMMYLSRLFIHTFGLVRRKLAATAHDVSRRIRGKSTRARCPFLTLYLVLVHDTDRVGGGGGIRRVAFVLTTLVWILGRRGGGFGSSSFVVESDVRACSLALDHICLYARALLLSRGKSHACRALLARKGQESGAACSHSPAKASDNSSPG